MRILFYCYRWGGGGAASMRLLLRALATEFPNDRLDILCEQGSPVASLRELENVKILDIPSSAEGERGRIKWAWTKLRAVARERGADVVWSLNLGPYRRLGVPSVLSVHNAYQVYPWKDAARWHPGGMVGAALLRVSFRRSLRIADGLITQTELMARYAGSIRGAPDRRDVIPKAVELSHAEAEGALSRTSAWGDDIDPGARSKRFTFLYAAAAGPHKDHRTAVLALRRLRAAGTEVRLVFTLPPEAIREIGWEAADLLASGDIVAAGWVSGAELRNLYTACDACVMPSRLESLSSSYLEAMAWGRPQVASDLPFARDVCGGAALYAAPGNVADWADKMALLASERELRLTLVARGRAVMNGFPNSWNVVAHRVRSFLATVARRGTSQADGPEAARGIDSKGLLDTSSFLAVSSRTAAGSG